MSQPFSLGINNLRLPAYDGFELFIEELSFGTGFYHLLGANGAGKSTLLDCIAGLYAPSFKALAINELPYNELSLQQLAQLRAYLTQQNQANFSITGFDMLAICFDKTLSEVKHLLIDHPVTKGLEVNLLLNKPLEQLSGGERQRCYLTAALLGCDPHWMPHSHLLLLDEPFNGLDIKHTLWLIGFLQSISARICVIASHHEVNFALKSKNPCLLMQKGRLLGDFKDPSKIKKQHLVDCFGLNAGQISYENDAYYQISWNLDEI